MPKTRTRHIGTAAAGTRSASTGYHHGDLRRTLLETATRLLEEKGPPGLSLREVARRSGVSQAAPYRHFPDKASLLAAVAAQGFRQLARCMTESAAGLEDPAERFRGLGRGYVRFALENAAMLRLMFGTETGDKSLHPELHEAAAAAYQVLADASSRVTDPGGQGAGMVALAAWSLVHGLSYLLVDGQVSPDEAEALDALVDRVLAMLRT